MNEKLTGRLNGTSLNSDHGRLLKQAAASADDEDAYRPTIGSAMAGDEAKLADVRRDFEDAKSCDRFLRLQQNVHRNR